MFSESPHGFAARARDAGVYGRYWVRNWAAVLRMAARRGPVEMGRRAKLFEWIRRSANPNRSLKLFVNGRTGPYREACAFLSHESTKAVGQHIDDYFARPHETILHEDLVPSEIFLAMGLNTWMAEMLGILVPIISQDLGEDYIDAAENAGTPPDVCSLPKLTMGLALSNHLPPPIALVASNMPCDGGMSSYAVMEKIYKVPIFRLDIPYNFYNERAEEYFAGELKRLIAWLTENTPGRMDWEKLREVCEERNRAVEYEMELWDLIARKPAPMAAEPVYFSHLLFMCTFPGRPQSTEVFKKIVEITRDLARQGKGALAGERFRAALWNPPTLSCPDLWTWAEQKYGTAMIMDMLTYNRQPYIDTKDPDTMLKGLARIIMQGPMSRHTRGPCENFFGDLFHLYERFACDMIFMAGHVGCKNTMALSGIFREKCRERGIPLLNIHYDLADSRVVSPENVKKQVDGFMETVMKV